MDNNKETIDYNSEPVFYCKHCMSLHIIDSGFMDYCANCGSTDIETASLEEYDVEHKKRFGVKLFYKD